MYLYKCEKEVEERDERGKRTSTNHARISEFELPAERFSRSKNILTRQNRKLIHFETIFMYEFISINYFLNARVLNATQKLDREEFTCMRIDHLIYHSSTNSLIPHSMTVQNPVKCGTINEKKII